MEVREEAYLDWKDDMSEVPKTEARCIEGITRGLMVKGEGLKV